MGMPLFSCRSSPYSIPNSNPDPFVFKILEQYIVGNHLVVWVNYPRCKNFEGTKVLIFKGVKSVAAILNATSGKLDPHFAARGISPVARFAPTDESRKFIAEAYST
jgi:hypothetical protein